MKKKKVNNVCPVASVVVLSFNRPEYTANTLEAVATVNAGVDFELIVVDNGSDEEAVDLLQEWNKSGLIDQLILLPENLGTSPGFNKGFARANRDSQFLTKLDNDILVLSENWLLEIIKVLTEEKDVGIAATDMVNHSALKQLPIITLPSGRTVKDWSGFRAGGGGMTFRKTLYEQLGGFKEVYPEDLKLMPDDIEFHHKVSALKLHSYYVCAAQSLIQREHEESYTDYRVWKARQYHLLRTRFFSSALGGDGFKPFTCDIKCNKKSFRAGDRVVVDLSITSHDREMCVIGMSIKRSGTREFVSDPDADIIVRTRAGKVRYMRWLHLPLDIRPGLYEVVLSLSRAEPDLPSERL